MRNGVGRIKTARAFLRRAEQELAQARPSMDDIGIRQAGEKGWAAAREVAKALLERRGQKAPKGTTALQKALLELAAHDPVVRKRYLDAPFSMALQSLHVDCFGEGTYSVKVIERMLRRVGEYVDDIAHLTK